MDTQTSYKRTVAGSVGAGMGAIFNGSGRTYYMLEHKTSSKYHQAGETQKIIIDQVELGRDASCQVRFDESFDTVSRKHAAIERDGDNWKLVHLSASNPTLVNGRPIQDSYYLQSGDEIQLSVNGPRLGFIVPQGKQALTSSIKLTERMNLFRQQALRPYRRAIWILGALLALAIIGFGTWNYKLSQDNEALRQEMATYQAQMDSLSLEKARLDNLEKQIQEKLAANPEDENLKNELNQVQEQRNRVQTLYVAANTNYNRARNKVSGFGKKDAEKEKEDADTDEKEVEEKEEVADNNKAKEASDNIANYYDDIYTLKVRRVTFEKGDEAVDAGIALSNVVVGTGFIVDGKFITAHQNIEPWLPIGGNYDADWKYELAIAKYYHRCNVIIDYEAYSTRGSGYPIRFSNLQFDLSGSVEELRETEVPTSVVEHLKDLGLVDEKAEKAGKGKSKEKNKVVVYSLPYYTEKSYLAVSLQMSAPGGLPIDREIANSLKGGETVTIAGFNNRTNIQNLSSNFKYWTSTTSRTGFNYITLQNTDPNSGFIGSPAFYKEADGSYRVVGVNAGVYFGENRVVPITRVP
jgi:hypothetical protein